MDKEKKKKKKKNTSTTKKKVSTKKKTTSTKKKVTTKKPSTKKTTTKRTSNTKRNTNTIKKTSINNNISKRKKKYKIKKRLFLISILIFFLVVSSLAFVYREYFLSPILSIKDVYLKDDSIVVVKFNKINGDINDKIYCLYTTSINKPSINDKNWFLTSNNECSFNIQKEVSHIYLKNEKNNIIKVNEADLIGTIKNFKINETKNYLAIKDILKLKVSYDKYGFVDDKIEWKSSNSKIATVKDGKVEGLKDGSVTITASLKGKSVSSEIIVTSLITKRPSNGFDFNKKDLSCDLYSKSDNDLLDEILKFKVNKVGYKTRAGAVEAARFLTLDFPYRINYFYENGRLTGNGVDGEGRYYHKGLYLDESRFNSIKKSRKGPEVWGCSLYSSPDGKKSRNGLDCSGYVSWVLLNGGFNPGDIGAGITKVKDLTDLGTKKTLTKKISTSNTIKVGDLLHNTWDGGHIAFILGIDDNYYYVSQAVWFDEVGVIINKYKKEELNKYFKEVIIMDKYYKKDGKLTNMW